MRYSRQRPTGSARPVGVPSAVGVPRSVTVSVLPACIGRPGRTWYVLETRGAPVIYGATMRVLYDLGGAS